MIFVLTEKYAVFHAKDFIYSLFADTPQNERQKKIRELHWYHIVFICSELIHQCDMYFFLNFFFLIRCIARFIFVKVCKLVPYWI